MDIGEIIIGCLFILGLWIVMMKFIFNPPTNKKK